MESQRSAPSGTEPWAILVETKGGGVEVYRGGITLFTAKNAADAIIVKRSEVRQITVYPVEGGHAQGSASWVRDQDRPWTRVHPTS